MAKQTRAQRRARRAERERQGNGADARPPVQRQPQMAGVGRAEPVVERRLPGSGIRRFVGESAAELKKVEWPGQTQVIQATVVVLIACIVVGAYLYFNDLIWKPVVQRLIGQ